ncbi:hypothetical protein ACQ4PT_000374 [Festuca glaucescens]
MSSREQQPRARKERSSFIVIPFSSTCRSASSVDVVQPNKPQGAGGAGEVASVGGGAERKPESLSLVARLLRGFKNLSHQIFAVHDDEDEDDEEEQEMVIGLPTDVKHVAHIGWDGSTSTTTSLRSWNRAAPNPPPDAAASTSSSSGAAPPEQAQAQPPALSARQLELAMAAQASAAGAGTSAAASTSGNGGTSTAQRRHRHYS